MATLRRWPTLRDPPTAPGMQSSVLPAGLPVIMMSPSGGRQGAQACSLSVEVVQRQRHAAIFFFAKWRPAPAAMELEDGPRAAGASGRDRGGDLRGRGSIAGLLRTAVGGLRRALYRFYALYDKISREDILAHAYAQCRSNKGATGVDGQDFADIEMYGIERWLAELALALRDETYRPEAIRRGFIPKANGKLKPLGISTVAA